VTKSSNLLSEIASNWRFHSHDSPWYKRMSARISEIMHNFSSENSTQIELTPIGVLKLPFFQMGNINSSHLFGLDELIIFSLYDKLYPRAVAIDLGANIGLHSMVLEKLGYFVISYEPDPIHAKQFEINLALNSVHNVKLHLSAVSTESGTAEFTRVKGNTTGSHLSGTSGKQPYGELEKFQVTTIDINSVLDLSENVTLVKMDVEGFEARLLSALDVDRFDNTDFILEVGSEENANEIFTLIKSHKLSSYSQKTSWGKVKNFEDMPTSYRDGTLVITKRSNLLSSSSEKLIYWS